MTHKLEPYEMERKKLLNKSQEVDAEKLQELFDIDVDVDVRKFPKESLPEDLTTKDIVALSFMIE